MVKIESKNIKGLMTGEEICVVKEWRNLPYSETQTYWAEIYQSDRADCERFVNENFSPSEINK